MPFIKKCQLDWEIQMSEYGYCGKEVVSKFNCESESSTKMYNVILYTDGTYSCSCLGWRFHKGERVNCKHIREIINTQLVVQEAENEAI